MWLTSSLTTVLTPTAVALGNFDGIHRGHQQVIQPILPELEVKSSLAIFHPEKIRSTEDKKFLDSSVVSYGEYTDKITVSERPYSTVVTFNPHPREFFTGQTRSLLTPIEEKVNQLHLLGVEQLVMLPFNRSLADLSPHEFVEQIVVGHLKAKRVSIGQDFCFGHRRSGTSTDLQAIAAQYNVEVIIVPIHNSQGERISSSAIREALASGNIEAANRMLGRSYTLKGLVVKGQQLGRTLGFPTANLEIPSDKLLPRLGVYAVRVLLEQQPAMGESGCPKAAQEWQAGVMNIGYRPTINGTCLTVEVHLLDWSGDLYGKALTLSLEKFLRPEQKFSSIEDLKQQIQNDCIAARISFDREITNSELGINDRT
ncbi:MAG TPA: bifunctional riboflavin kinase/FAD synthetase [Leptolyngbyaceae cyanobacterium]